MDTSSALPAAAAAHLGGMARVPDASLPIDFSPGNPADFAALLAAQPVAARMTSEGSAARGAAGADGGRGGTLPDSGKRLPSGPAAGRSRGDGNAEAPPGAAAAAARREARGADDAPPADGAGTGGESDDDAPCDAETRAERASRAADARLAPADPTVPPPTLPIAGDPASTAVVTPVIVTPAGNAPVDLAQAAGAIAEGSACAADDAGPLPVAAEATAALPGEATVAEVDAPLGRMIAAGRAAGGAPLAGANRGAGHVPAPEPAVGALAAGGDAPVAATPATGTDKATLAAAALASPGQPDSSRAHADGKPTAGGAVRMDAPPLAGGAMGGGMADNAGGAAMRQGHREAPPSALPVAASATGSGGNPGVPAADPRPAPAPLAAPPAGLSALAANAALAALRSGAIGGAMNAQVGATGEAAAVAGLVVANADLSTAGVASAAPAQAALPPGLLAGLAPPPGSAVNSPRAAVEVQAPPGSPAFADELAGRVAVLVQQDAGGATLKLNPGHLGPVEVRVQVRDGEATVMFAAHHAATREALEGAAPRLRELLVQQGYTQVSVDVAAQGQDLAQRQAAWNQARPEGGGREGRGPWRDAPGGVAGAGSAEALRPRAAGARGGGRLDAFA